MVFSTFRDKRATSLTFDRTGVRMEVMRWDGQGVSVDDGALPGLQRIGFVRSVRTPQFEGITFHEVLCKSALNKVPERGDAAVPVHRQRLPRLLARLPLLLRAAHPRVPRHGLRHRLRHPGRGQDQRRRGAAPRAAPAVMAAGDRRAGHQHRPVPTRRGPLRADAGHHRRAGGFRYTVLHPHQGHAAAPRSAADRRGRRQRRRQRRGVAGGRRSRTAQGRRAGHAVAAGAARD